MKISAQMVRERMGLPWPISVTKTAWEASVAISAVNIAGGFLVPRLPMFLRSDAFQNGYE